MEPEDAGLFFAPVILLLVEGHIRSSYDGQNFHGLL